MTNQQLLDYWLIQLFKSNEKNKQKQNNIILKLKELIETSDDFDIARAAKIVSRYGGSSSDILWAKQQIERGIGDVAWYAYLLYKDDRYNIVSLEWVMQQVERGIGSVKRIIFCLHELQEVGKSWAEQQLAKLEQNNDKSTTF